jgi:hypothetical protein
MVHASAATHLSFFLSVLLGRTNILDLSRLCLMQVDLESNTTVKANLSMIVFKDSIEEIGGSDCQRAVGRIALRYYLYMGLTFPAAKNTTSGLVDDFFRHRYAVFNKLIKKKRCHISSIGPHAGLERLMAIAQYHFGSFEQVGVGTLALVSVFCIHYRQYASLGPAAMISKAGHLRSEFIPTAPDQTPHNAHYTPQQARTAGCVNIAFNAFATGVDLCAFLIFLYLCIIDETAVDHFPTPNRNGP